jgi:hypothetical protein
MVGRLCMVLVVVVVVVVGARCGRRRGNGPGPLVCVVAFALKGGKGPLLFRLLSVAVLGAGGELLGPKMVECVGGCVMEPGPDRPRERWMMDLWVAWRPREHNRHAPTWTVTQN